MNLTGIDQFFAEVGRGVGGNLMNLKVVRGNLYSLLGLPGLPIDNEVLPLGSLSYNIDSTRKSVFHVDENLFPLNES